MKRFLFFLLGALCLFTGQAQLRPTPDQLGSIYHAYPAPGNDVTYTVAPDGYKPFYISHYGRHGSRWRTADEHYLQVVDVFDSLYQCRQLTPLGEDVRLRLHRVWEDARGCSGNITPIGERQHHDIAARMYGHYPEVFQDSSVIDARSSTSLRCALSMSYFTEALKERNPALRVSRRAYTKYMDYIAHTSPEAETFCAAGQWTNGFSRFQSKLIRPERLMKSLFTCPQHFTPEQSKALMTGLYWIAVDLQNCDLPGLTLYDIFQYEELYDLWRTVNARMYVCNAASPLNGGLMPRQAIPLVRNIVESADHAIRTGNHAADLRFGHDTHLIRLLALMEMEGCANRETDFEKIHLAWQDYHVSPMGANLQLIFFRNATGQVLVKLLLNEHEVRIPALTSAQGSYYEWETLKKYLLSRTKDL